jgi:Zn-dependent peptidase ImmA (M78 family)
MKKRVGYPREYARKLLNEYFVLDPPFRLPIPIEKFSQFHGFEIYSLDDLFLDQRALKMEIKEEGRKLIGLNAKHHRHSQRFSIGHELGHFFLGHPLEDDSEEDEIKLYNQETDEFSAELLIPLDQLKAELHKSKDVNKVARIFDVSEEAIWIEIKNQNLLSLLS